jgi:hypothetical protein
MMNKTIKITYWTTTLFLSLGMTLSALGQLTQQPVMIESMKLLGYPPQILILLGGFKLLGAFILVFPGYPKIREWGYAGFIFLFIGATFSHFAVGDYNPTTIVLLGVVFTSYFTWKKMGQSKSVVATIG